MRELHHTAAALAVAVFLIGLMWTSAAPAVEFKVGNPSAKAGEPVSIEIEMIDSPGMLSLSFTLEYDSAAFIVEDVLKKDPIDNFLLVHNVVKPGELRVVMAGARAAEGSGVILTIEGQVTAEAVGGSATPLHLLDVHFNGDEVPVDLHDGTLSIAGSVSVGRRLKTPILWARLKSRRLHER